MAIAPFTPIQLLKRLPQDLARIHLTFVSPEGTTTFSSENAMQLQLWWLVEVGRLGNSYRNHWCVLTKLEITPFRDVETGLPISRVSSCYFAHGVAMPRTGDKTRHAARTDNAIGGALSPVVDVVFVDF